MSILGAVAACVFAIAIPSVYYAISISETGQTLTVEADFFAKSIEKIIQTRPDLWEFESVRLKELISQPSIHEKAHEMEIRNEAGKLVTKTDSIESRPIISVSAPFFDSGKLAGSIVVRHSIRTQVITTALLGILGALLGSLIYFIFRTYPIRKLENTLTDLQRERDKPDNTLSAIGDAVITTDHKGKILFINRVAESLVGMDASEAVGRQLEDVYVLRQGQENQAGEKGCILTSKGGNEYAIEEVRIPLTEMESDKLWVVIIFRDISERKRAEAKLRETNCSLEEAIAKANEMAARESIASVAKSAFLSNMSHEIRTPMNAILGFAQVLERDPLLTPRQIEHVRIITRSGAHLLKLINDILDMSKIEAGRTTLNEAAFCLHDFMDDLETMFRSRTDAKGLQLIVERDESVPRCVTADEGKLRQVLVNLMGNAIKFTETGGVAVRMRAEAIKEKTVEGKEALRLVAEVEDTGPGIPEEDMDRLFVAFQQTELGLNAGGTGLGLVLARSHVEMMGGKLTVTSRVGEGSCFRFEVLLETAEDSVKREKLTSQRVVGLEYGTGPFRILVVDDMPDNRALLRELLRPVGFEVREAINGVEALEVFEQWSPHAVLMDMRMPLMDGYEATLRLKSTEAGRATPIIAVTASAFDDARTRAMATGADAYLRKPFRPTELFEVLGEFIGLRYVFAEETADAPGRLNAEPLTAESLAALPKDMVEAMSQAVAEGDMARLTELIGHAEKVDSVVARGLRVLADRYDYEKLRQWLEKRETGNG